MKVALSLLAAAVLAHLYLFDSISLQFDELLMYELISRYHTWDLIPMLYVEETQQPLGYLIVKFFMTIKNSTLMMRLPTLIITLMTPLAFYKLARLSFSREDSLKGGVLLILFFPFLMYSGSMRPYVPFVFFTIVAYHQFLQTTQDQRKLYTSLALLFFIHPMGSIISFILSGNILLKRKNGINIFLVLTFLLLLFLTIAGLFRYEEIAQLLISFSLKQYYRALYNFSFLISGREFFAFVLGLILVVCILKLKNKRIEFKIEKIWIHSFAWSVASALVLMCFFGKHIYPRHYMFLLPGLAIIVMRLINASTDKTWQRHLLFILACLILSYKSIWKEKLHDIPFEIDSASIAKKASDMAVGDLAIVSCGNCFTFYLHKKHHLCSGASLPPGYFENANEAIYVELNYVKNKCGLEKITEPFRVEQTATYKGGKIHHLIFQAAN